MHVEIIDVGPVTDGHTIWSIYVNEGSPSANCSENVFILRLNGKMMSSTVSQTAGTSSLAFRMSSAI